MREIFAPLDGTAAGETALPWVGQAARRSSARAHLFSVVPMETACDGVAAEREDYLRAHQRNLESRGIQVTIEVARGDPAQRILARARRSDLTVMTSGTVRWIVSAVLDRVLQDIEAPVVVVRTTPGQASVPPEPEKILVSLDSASYSREILPVVASLATSLHSSITLCHIIPALGGFKSAEEAPPGVARMIAEWLETPPEFLTAAAEELRVTGTETEIVTSIGEPSRQIVRLAESCGAGLIAMATRGRDSLGQRVIGSVANRVLETTAIPCLLLRRTFPISPKAAATGRVPA